MVILFIEMEKSRLGEGQILESRSGHSRDWGSLGFFVLRMLPFGSSSGSRACLC